MPSATIDWGAETLARFRYQAEVTVPFCLAAALGVEGILAVVPEHLEDIALDCGGTWRFVQVKSRNEDLGLWTLSQLLGKGGALRSLFRTYICADGQLCSLELMLEGAPKRRDPIQQLYPDGDRSEIVDSVATSLGIAPDVASSFLEKVVLNAPPPPRDYITAYNKDLLHRHAPQLTRGEVDACYDRVVQVIESAMRAQRLGARWPSAVVNPARRSSRAELLLAEKTLHAATIRSVLAELSAPARPILRKLVQAGSGPISQLHKKMLEGGAPEAVISHARNLQANAHFEHLQRQASGQPTDEEGLDDLHERLRIHATAKVALHAGAPTPAVLIWSDLLELFESRAGSIDAAGILRKDPMLLLGEVCEISDRCVFDWGRVDDR